MKPNAEESSNGIGRTNMASLTKEIINAAITGFEAQKKHIDAQIAGLRSMLTGQPTAPVVQTASSRKPGPKAKRRLSATGRKAIADAAKKRWALIHAEQAKAAKKKA